MKALDIRSRTILKEIIRVHVDTGRPVSSRALFKSNRFHLSPASIRNIMADLTDLGFLTQPHTSAGRVPTDRAYRLYIDELMRHRRIAVDVREQVDSDLSSAGADVPRLFQAASRLLSRLSGEVGFVVAPDALHTVVDGLRFLPVAPGKILVPRWVQLVGLPLAIVGVWLLVSAVNHAVFVFVVAALIAILLNPIVRAFCAMRIPRGMSVLLVYVCFAVAIPKAR